jgi:hypothetical protein
MKKMRLQRGVLPVLLFLATPPVFAQDNVESKLRRLEDNVRVLERRVADLEAQLRAQRAAIPIAPDKVSWRK